VLLAVALLALPACAQQMADNAAYRPLTPSDFFADGRSARPVVPGTVARGQMPADTAFHTGRDDKGKLVTEFPIDMTKAVLQRGKARFAIFCSVCHGLTGHGDGRIVKRGFTAPPNYITDDSRALGLLGEKVVVRREHEREGGPKLSPLKLSDVRVPVGHFFEVITQGFGAMPDHASQVPVKDRWAISGYIRALQYSQSPALRKKEGKQ
jgi:hypothetical protein